MPRAKQSDHKSIPSYLNVCLCDLLIVITNHSLTGNFKHLYWNGKSVGIRGITVSIILIRIDFICNLVLLHKFVWA